MHDSLAFVGHPKVRQLEGLDIVLQGQALCARIGLFDECLGALVVGSAVGGNVLWQELDKARRGSCGERYVIDGGEGAVGSAHSPAGVAQAFEGLGRSDFVHEVSAQQTFQQTAPQPLQDGQQIYQCKLCGRRQHGPHRSCRTGLKGASRWTAWLLLMDVEGKTGGSCGEREQRTTEDAGLYLCDRQRGRSQAGIVSRPAVR